jgi:hypothetical protein
MHKLLFLLVFSILSFSAHAGRNTPDYYKCKNRVGGEWDYGRAPSGCDASSFGSDAAIKRDYAPLIFSDSLARDPERRRYMEEMHSVIRDASAYYFKKRVPSASAAELAAFQLLVLTTAAQESYWSHYRLASDAKYKMMRGDGGHGHGIVQIDDRQHFDAIQAGKAGNLLGNLSYGMDILYSGWLSSKKASCVKSSTDYSSRIRSAWAAYNGGPAKLCRWVNKKDKWAENDNGFYRNLTNQSWKTFVKNFAKPAKINVACLMEWSSNCPTIKSMTGALSFGPELYSLSEGEVCLAVGNELKCLNSEDAACMHAVGAFASDEAIPAPPELLSRTKYHLLDRHGVCRAFEPNLKRLGQDVMVAENLELFDKPGSGIIGEIESGSIVTILDFRFQDSVEKERYYKISFQGKVGWILGGTAKAPLVSDSGVEAISPSEIAKAGERVQVLRRGGQNLRSFPDGPILALVPEGSLVNVTGLTFKGPQNSVFYHVEFQGHSGYLYSGDINPVSSINRWTKRIP